MLTIGRACCLEEPEDPEEVHESGQETQVYRVCVGPRTEEMSSTRRAELVDSLQMGDGSWTEDQRQLLS